MHCVAGDGVGILASAVLSSVLGITGIVEMVLEYVLGFAFGGRSKPQTIPSRRTSGS